MAGVKLSPTSVTRSANPVRPKSALVSMIHLGVPSNVDQFGRSPSRYAIVTQFSSLQPIQNTSEPKPIPNTPKPEKFISIQSLLQTPIPNTRKPNTNPEQTETEFAHPAGQKQHYWRASIDRQSCRAPDCRDRLRSGWCGSGLQDRSNGGPNTMARRL
jgi:hypothetical protein